MDISAKWIPVELTKENFNDIFSIERNFQSTQIKATCHVLTKILVTSKFQCCGTGFGSTSHVKVGHLQI